LTLQVTPAVGVLETVALNGCVCPRKSEAEVGETVTTMGGGDGGEEPPPPQPAAAKAIAMIMYSKIR